MQQIEKRNGKMSKAFDYRKYLKDKPRPLSKEQKTFTGVCQKCMLYANCHSGKMPGYGSDNPDILFIGEAPGGAEDEWNTPFIGKAGQTLHNALSILLDEQPEDYLEWVRFTNAVRCRPPNNKTPTKAQLNYCNDFLWDEIAETDPKVVVLLGNAPLQAVLGKSGITAMNGNVHEIEGMYFVPAFHPSYVMRQQNDNTNRAWMDALDKAISIALDEQDVTDVTEEWVHHTPRTLDEFDECMNILLTSDFYREYQHLTTDVETSWLHWEKLNSKISVISFAVGTQCVTIPLQHKDSWWTVEEYGELTWILDDLLNNHNIIGHNIRFDQKWIKAHLGIDFVPWGDTLHIARMLFAHIKGRDLNNLSATHLGVMALKQEIDDYTKQHPECNPKIGGDFSLTPLDILLPYAGGDTIATSLLHAKLYSQFTNKERILYHQLMQPASNFLSRLEMNGFYADQPLAQKMQKIYQNCISDLFIEMEQDEDVQIYIDFALQEIDDKFDEKYLHIDLKDRDRYVQAVFNSTFHELDKQTKEEIREELKQRDTRADRENHRKKFSFNPNSPMQMRDIIYGVKGYDILGYTDSGLPSVSWDYVKELKDEEPFFQNFRYYVLYSDVLSKYIKPIAEGDWFYGNDSRVRSNINLALAKSGRTSSSDPTNFQNWPSVESEFGSLLTYQPPKNCLRASPGWFLIDADYNSAELRVMASVANIPGMLAVFDAGRDPHIFVTRMIFSDQIHHELLDEDTIEADKEIKRLYSHLRYRAKWTNWTFLFGGTWYTLHRLYGLSKEESKDIQDRYFEAFPELKDFHDHIKHIAHKFGYVESVMGRRLILNYTQGFHKEKNTGFYKKDIRTALDFPIQGPASDLLLMAGIVVDNKMQKMGLQSKLVNVVHDSIIADVHPSELEIMQELFKYNMQNLPTVQKEEGYFPDIPLDWLKLQMKTGVDVQTYYGSKGG